MQRMVSVGFEEAEVCLLSAVSKKGWSAWRMLWLGMGLGGTAAGVWAAWNLFTQQPEEPAVCAVDGTAGS